MNLRLSPSARVILLLGAGALFSTVSFLIMYESNVVNLLVDAQSHWIHAFLIVRSITPGVTQIGFWPPLLHVILVPAALAMPVSFLQQIGAFVILLPMTLASAYFLWGVLRSFRVSRALSLLGAALLLLHPFVQYFTTSAMAEVPLIFSVLGSAFFAMRWRRTNAMLHLSLFGIFVSLTVLSRYEGALLVPVATAFVLLDRLEKRISFQQMKAELSIFLFMAVLGTALVLIYSYVYAGTLFGFLSLGSDRVFDASAVARRSITLASVKESLRMFYHASVHMHGRWAVLLFPVGFLALLVRRKWEEFFVVLILLTPALFVLYMMFIGRNTISVAELPPFGSGRSQPYGFFANTRYALTWVGALCLVLVLGVQTFVPGKGFLGKFGRAVLATGLIAIFASWYGFVTFESSFSTIRRDETASPERAPFIPEYDGGRVLMTRNHNVAEIYFSGIPSDMLVLETNYRYFPQALREPWLFVRWVVIRRNLTTGVDVDEYRSLGALQDMEKDPVFLTYFKLARESRSLAVYRLRDEVVRKAAVSLGYDPAKIPSLNVAAPWKPTTIYEDILRR